jgi:hypothetical protein
MKTEAVEVDPVICSESFDYAGRASQLFGVCLLV